MRYLIYGLLFISTNVLAQTYPVPVALFDTMVTEIKRGRVCNELQALQAKELETAGKLLLVKDRALELSQSIISAKETESTELRSALLATDEATKLKVKKARKSGFIGGVSLSGGVAILLVLLL